MTDKHELLKSRGAHAEALLNDELLKEAFSMLEHEYIEFWKNTPVRDQDARERMWHAIAVLGKVQGHLHKVASDGKIARRQIEELQAGQIRKSAGLP